MKGWIESRKQSFKKANWWDKSQPILTVILIIIFIGVKLSLIPLLLYVLWLELDELYYRQAYQELKDNE